MAAILNFQFFAKNAKTQNASLSLTVRDRAISSKFSTPKVSEEYAKLTFENFSKMAAILNFRIFAKVAKHKIASISLTVGELQNTFIAML